MTRKKILIIAGPNGAGKTTDLVDAWALYDNSGAEPVLMDWREKP